MKRISILIITAILTAILSSCQTGRELEQLQRLHEGYGPDMSGNEAVTDDDVLDRGPERGGTLKLFTTKPDTLNPILTTNSYMADILGFIYESMTRLDKNQKAVPVLADKWTVSDDGLIWEFHMRDGIQWHDGEPFTAYDVEFTIQTILNPSIKSPYKSMLLNVSQCVATDSSTVRIALKKPNSFMPEMMSFPIIPRHQFLTVDVLTASRDLEPVGTGPYRFVSYDADDKIMLTLNEGWWYMDVDETLKSNGMYIENIHANIFGKIEDAMGAFLSGDVDVAGIGISEYHKYMERTDLTIKKYTSRNYEFISMNLNDPVLSDIYARQAIALVIDREKIISEVLKGAAVEAELPILPECWLEDAKGSIEGKNSGSDGINTPDPDMEGNTPDSDAAGTPDEVLTLGGWKKNEQGYYKVIKGSRRYLTLELLVNSNNSLRVKAAEMIRGQLEEAGIKASVVQLSWKDMMTRINSGKYKMALLGCRIPQIPDISFMYSDGYLPYASSTGYSEAYNISGYESMDVDEYISGFFSENSATVKKEVYKALKARVLQDCPYIGLYFLQDAMVYSKHVKGNMIPDTWNRFYDIYHWYKPVP
jgi:peptide/nickel transport system substrate-binding protein